MLLKFVGKGRELGGESNIGGKRGLRGIMTIELYYSNTIFWVEENFFEVEKPVTLLKNEDFRSFQDLFTILLSIKNIYEPSLLGGSSRF